eukprot:4373655-Pleurochrysis_carterae.AAC.1
MRWLPRHRDSHHGLARRDAGELSLSPAPRSRILFDPTRPSRLRSLLRAPRRVALARRCALRPASAWLPLGPRTLLVTLIFSRRRRQFGPPYLLDAPLSSPGPAKCPVSFGLLDASMHGLHVQAAILCLSPPALLPRRQSQFSEIKPLCVTRTIYFVPTATDYFLWACLWPPSFFCVAIASALRASSAFCLPRGRPGWGVERRRGRLCRFCASFFVCKLRQPSLPSLRF